MDTLVRTTRLLPFDRNKQDECIGELYQQITWPRLGKDKNGSSIFEFNAECWGDNWAFHRVRRVKQIRRMSALGSDDSTFPITSLPIVLIWLFKDED